jgi:polyisoprenoid-binding protein YceI
MRFPRFLIPFVLLPLVLFSAERPLKIDASRSYVDVDVKMTVGSFTAHLDSFTTNFAVDDSGKIKTGVFTFKFTDLKTGNPDRDAKMIEWLGGGTPEGKFELAILALAPDGQGQVTGKLTFHGAGQRIEFAVNITQENGTYVMTGDTTIDYRDWNLKVIKKAYVYRVDHDVRVRFKFTGSLPAPPEAKEP